MSLVAELRRRNVIRAASAYVVAAWLLVQVAETLLPVFGAGDTTIRIVVIALAIGFVPAVIGAWVFEWTPEGLKLDSDSAVDKDTRRSSARRLDRIFLVVLTLAVGYFAFDKFLLDPVRDRAREEAVAEQARSEALTGYYGDRSIAVLPFTNLTPDPDQEYFADGMSEEILNLLADIHELRVISRTSAFAFKGQAVEIPEIAQRLNVGHVLEGSVRTAGNRIRVTAQLIQARTDTHLWSRTYDRELGDVFAIQDEIANDVARNLKVTLVQPGLRSRVTDPKVFALTLQAKHLWEVRPPDIGERMHDLLAEALAIDPDYVPALEWSVAANFFLSQSGMITKDQEHALYQQVKQRVLELDPDNASILSYDAWSAAYEGPKPDLQRAARLYSRAVESDPSNSNVVRFAAAFAMNIGRMDAAIRLADHAAAIDPLCFQCIYWVSRINMYAGNLERAQEARERFLKLGDGGYYHYGLMKLLQDEPAAALQIFEGMGTDNPEALPGIAMAQFDLGNDDAAAAALRQLRDSDEPEDILAEVLAWMGQNDEAFEILGRMAAREDRHRERTIIFNPVFRNLHNDPRWKEWRASIGMSEAALAAVEFDPKLPG